MSSSSAIRNEAITEANSAASAPAYASLMSGAASLSTTHHDGLEASLAHRSMTFIFVVAVVLSLAIFIATYCIAYIIWSCILRQGESDDRNYAYRASVQQQAMEAEREMGQGGLEASLVRSFPILQYSLAVATEEMKAPHGMQNECAVCLSEFEAGEEMKVLPVCRHGFHKACIDRWLLSHTTCPLCRLSLLKRLDMPTR